MSDDEGTATERLIVRLWCGDVPDGSRDNHRAYLAALPDDERDVLLAALDDSEYLEWLGPAVKGDNHP